MAGSSVTMVTVFPCIGSVTRRMTVWTGVMKLSVRVKRKRNLLMQKNPRLRVLVLISSKHLLMTVMLVKLIILGAGMDSVFLSAGLVMNTRTVVMETMRM